MQKGGLVVTTKRNGSRLSSSLEYIQCIAIILDSVILLTVKSIYQQLLSLVADLAQVMKDWITWMSHYLILYGHIMERLLYYNIPLVNIDHNLLSQAHEYMKTLIIFSLAVHFKNWLLTCSARECYPGFGVQSLLYNNSEWTFYRKAMQTDYFCV